MKIATLFSAVLAAILLAIGCAPPMPPPGAGNLNVAPRTMAPVDKWVADQSAKDFKPLEDAAVIYIFRPHFHVGRVLQIGL